MQPHVHPITYARSTITITFGDRAENHVGMQMIGEAATTGFSTEDLLQAGRQFQAAGFHCELYRINDMLPPGVEAEESSILIVRQALGACTEHTMFAELAALPVDTKILSRGKVLNKHARYNLVFDKEYQAPDYATGKGTVISYDQVPQLAALRDILPTFLGPLAANLVAEGNFYYHADTCGISFHGDGERRKVVALRLGQSMPLHYQWFQQCQPIGDRLELILHDGDLYVMSEYATGFNWKKRIIPTLRHAAGAPNYLIIKK